MKQLTLVILLTLAATLAHPQSYDFTHNDKTLHLELITPSSPYYTLVENDWRMTTSELAHAIDNLWLIALEFSIKDPLHTCSYCTEPMTPTGYINEIGQSIMLHYAPECLNYDILTFASEEIPHWELTLSFIEPTSDSARILSQHTKPDFPQSINYANKDYIKTSFYTEATLRTLIESADNTGLKVDWIDMDESHSCDDCFNISSTVYTNEQSSESITLHSSKCENIWFLTVQPLIFFTEHPTYIQQYEATMESVPLIKLAFPEAFNIFD